MSAVKWIVIAAGIAGGLYAVLATWGTLRWRTATETLVQRLDAASLPVEPARYDSARELPGLPAPVQRWFRSVLTEGQPMIAAVTIEHSGSFDMGGAAPQWKPFTSWQRALMRRPGFVWNGTVAMAPGLPVRVHDAYVAGEGVLRPAILGLYTLTDLHASSAEPGGVAHGELMRFVAEAAWYPTALLPSQGVRWETMDDRSARATLADGALSITLTFVFADDGSIESVRSEARGRTVDGGVLLTPWEGRWSDLRMHDGMRVPGSGEVAWITPQGRRPYWRGTVQSLRYEFAGAR